MSYQPLARKYRPSQFCQLVGQESVSVALSNAIAMHREPHAVIFTGVRGVGKTTVARLYAKALNCEHREASPKHPVEPCDRCESCLAIIAGNHEDVLEIDGASNNGVGDVRALQETVGYRPQRSAYKVYIIDEVHMLSPAAFNALLKTLEEPPAHVVFAFATTEIGSVPQTIMSRCQAFYLKKLPTAAIHARLVAILASEAVAAEDKAVAVLAREGHGSLRDALTLVDQAIALGRGQVTVRSLDPLVSTLSSSPYLALLGALVARDAAKALAVVAELDQSGAELAAVVEASAQLARHAFVAQGLGTGALDVALLGLDDAEVATLAALAAAAAPLDLNRIFRTLVKCRTELDGSALDRCVLENYLFEWCFDPGLPDIEALLGGARAPAGAPAVPGPPAGGARGGGGFGRPAEGPLASAVPAGTGALVGGSPVYALPLRGAVSASPEAGMPAGAGTVPGNAPAPPAAGGAVPENAAQAASRRRGGAGLRSAMSEFRGDTGAKAAPPKDAGGVASAAAGPRPGPLQHPAERLTGSGGDDRSARPADADVAPPPADSDAPWAAAEATLPPGPAARQAPRSGGASRPIAEGPVLQGAPPPARFGGTALAGAELVTGAGAPAARDLPATWRQLVDGWKQQKPLQARKLEEAHPLEYGPERIVLAISEDSYAGKGLLAREEQGRIRDQFHELFGFNGALVVVSAKSQAPSAPAEFKAGAGAEAGAPLPDTILAERRRESAARRERLVDETKNAPFTRDILAALGGTLEDVRIPDGDQL